MGQLHNSKNNQPHFSVKEMKNFNNKTNKDTIWKLKDQEILDPLKIQQVYKNRA